MDGIAWTDGLPTNWVTSHYLFFIYSVITYGLAGVSRIIVQEGIRMEWEGKGKGEGGQGEVENSVPRLCTSRGGWKGKGGDEKGK